jgi:transcriptional regulator with XRE-family HTH domain
MGTDEAVVVDRRGRTTPLGSYVFGLISDTGLSVSEVARRSGLSRSFLYLLRADEQVPALDTLVTLFEALGVDEVRAAAPGEPGDLAVTVGGRERWVRLPRANKRAERSRNAWASLAASDAPLYDDPWAAPAPIVGSPPPDRAASAAADSGAPSPRRSGTAYSRESGFARASKADPRQRRLGELMAAAADLDEDRLDLLLQHAKLLGRDGGSPR